MPFRDFGDPKVTSRYGQSAGDGKCGKGIESTNRCHDGNRSRG